MSTEPEMPQVFEITWSSGIKLQVLMPPSSVETIRQAMANKDPVLIDKLGIVSTEGIRAVVNATAQDELAKQVVRREEEAAKAKELAKPDSSKTLKKLILGGSTSGAGRA